MIMDIAKDRTGSTAQDILHVILKGANNGDEPWP